MQATTSSGGSDASGSTSTTYRATTRPIICDAASEELDRRIRYVPSFDERLRAFRRRCGVLAETA